MPKLLSLFLFRLLIIIAAWKSAKKAAAPAAKRPISPLPPLEITFFTRVLIYLLPGICIYSLEHLKDFCWIRFFFVKYKSFKSLASKIWKRQKKINPGPCAWQSRTDYTNNNKIFSITISEQIFEFEAKFLKLLLLAKKTQFKRNLPNVPKNKYRCLANGKLIHG